MTRADRAEVTWDPDKREWVVRVVVGAEVIKRRCKDVAAAADEAAIRSAALRVAEDEGYALDAAAVTVRR